MEAMLEVQGKRKLEAAERKSDKDRIEGLKLIDADNESEPARKRPSAGKQAPKVKLEPKVEEVKLKTKKEVETTMKRRPAAAASTAAKGRPACPPEDTTEVTYYKCGKVYNSAKRKAFRAMRCANDYYTETSAAWKDDRAVAWDKVLSAIEAYAAKQA